MEDQKVKYSLPSTKISAYLQLALNVALLFLSITLCVLLAKEIIYFISISIFTPNLDIKYDHLERILVFFLYFEFIAMIAKYFQEEYHFPIRYFLYIGITAMVRLIIVYHDNPLHTLLFTLATLVLILGFVLMNSASGRKGRM
ncbi:phosphate-starvation-inducible protein PsiE [Peribacillus sp. SCS-155]|uniref:phosphate-starvation-inducible protein PsiE n=1 Tax=Peribacillus sedimenti TaxID=3115297 RepID=UPI003906A825